MTTKSKKYPTSYRLSTYTIARIKILAEFLETSDTKIIEYAVREYYIKLLDNHYALVMEKANELENTR